MEQQMNDLTIFESYHNQQVILNYYQEEDFLWKREGFHFDSVQVSAGYLIFTNNEGNPTRIALKDFQSTAINSDFQNYYIFRSGQDRLEIYFP